jgi:hypothetical protein
VHDRDRAGHDRHERRSPVLGCLRSHRISCELFVERRAGRSRTTPQPPSDLAPEIPAVVDRLVLRCLAPRDRRFAGIRELAGALVEALAESPIRRTNLARASRVARPAAAHTTARGKVGDTIAQDVM